MEPGYDYIIVGGGSAGCVAATRLVRDNGARVLLIERGVASGHPILRMPAGYMKFLAREDYLEMHQGVPQPQLGGGAPIVPQARLLGGGGAINAIVYCVASPRTMTAGRIPGRRQQLVLCRAASRRWRVTPASARRITERRVR